MLRYRIAPNPTGRYIVLAASTSWVSIDETYATRIEAQDTADWLNRLRETEWQGQPHQVRVR
jgi:hypothetical protein